MSIFGLAWVASWFGSFSSLTEKVLEAPRHLSHVFFSQQSVTPYDSSNESKSESQGVTLPSAKKLNSKLSLISDHRGQSTPSTAVWLGAIETLLFNPAYQPTSYSLALGHSANFSIVALNEADSVQPHRNPLNYLLGVVQNFFWAVPPGVAATDFAHFTPAVVVVQSGTDYPPSQMKCAAWQESASQPSAIGEFQVWVKGCLVARLADQSSADKVAANLTKLLENPDLDASQLTPAYEREMPVGKLGDRVVFAIDHELSAQFDRPAELVAIEWVNNLRIALGQDPLSVADAQVRMHDLQDTGSSIGGLASWYGAYFHGRQTATGEIFDQNELTAAHPSLPFGTFLKVTNLLNGESVVVRVNDRGPYFDNRILDLSSRAARCIGSEDQGVIPIEAEIMSPTPGQEVARL